MPGIEFRDVARRLTCAEFARVEMETRGDRARCPFHHGEHFNLQLLRNGRCHCHVCGAGGDVIQLAAAVWGLSQRDAAVELNARFKLGLTGETLTADQQRQRQQERQAEQERRAAEREADARQWATACEAEQSAQAAIERFTAADADRPEFRQALTRLCRAQERCDLLAADRAGV